MRGGSPAYSALPQVWIQVFFISLAVLDPLVVVLTAFVRRAGIWLAAGVMVVDGSSRTESLALDTSGGAAYP